MNFRKLVLAAVLCAAAVANATEVEVPPLPKEFTTLADRDIAVICAVHMTYAASKSIQSYEGTQVERYTTTAMYLLAAYVWAQRADDAGGTPDMADRQVDAIRQKAGQDLPQVHYCFWAGTQRYNEMAPADRAPVRAAAMASLQKARNWEVQAAR